MSDNLSCQPARVEDARALTGISVKAFHSDSAVGAPQKNSGPPGYESIPFHRKMINVSYAFFKILNKDEIIGGFWINQKKEDHFELTRIFIEPSFQRKGIGLRSLNYLFRKYPHVTKWTLDTPKWNIRTKKFYEKLGFFVKSEDEELFHFLKLSKSE